MWFAGCMADGLSSFYNPIAHVEAYPGRITQMTIMQREYSALLIVDFQTRLMPAIDGADAVVANARRLLRAADMFDVPIVVTEQNAGGLGRTVPELQSRSGKIADKMTFDACRAESFLATLRDRRDVIVAGCEAHVCVLQTALGLLREGRRVFAVRDALGSRRAESERDGNSPNGAEWRRDRDQRDGDIRMA